MSYLNPPYPNNFQELCAAMPLFYLDVFEIRAILRAQGHLLDGICGGVENVVDFNFILTADDATIRMWEKALKITYKRQLTLDQRKRIIIGYIIGLGHIGEPEIRKIVSLYTNFSVTVSFHRGHISITIDGIGCISGYTNLIETLYKRIPAHLGLGFTVNIRSPTTSTLYIGGVAASVVRAEAAEKADELYFQDELYPGGQVSVLDMLPPRQNEDVWTVRAPLYAGGAAGALEVLDVGEDTAPKAGAPAILRTGGVCTIITNPAPGGAQR